MEEDKTQNKKSKMNSVSSENPDKTENKNSKMDTVSSENPDKTQDKNSKMNSVSSENPDKTQNKNSKMNLVSSENPEHNKEGIRMRIWRHMEDNDIAIFPRPVMNRIPNFKGSDEACDKAVQLNVFEKANVIKINPDKPQQQARFRTLEADKTLLVPTPRLRAGLFNKIIPPSDANKELLKICAQSQGVRRFSKPIDLDDKITIDLVIVGSVAVSVKGWRIGKGEGFADMEWAMMRCMNAVDNNTVIVTIVHDCQVIDIDADLITPNDITVDFIVTPTRVIECPKHDKPMGIIWNMLSRDKFNRIPVLRKLRQREREAGIDVTLAKKSVTKNKDDNVKDDKTKKDNRRRMPYARNIQRKKSENTSDFDQEGAEDIKEERRRPKPRRRQNSNRQRKDTNTSQSGGEDEGTKSDPSKRRYNRPKDTNSLSENEGNQDSERSPRRNKSRRFRAKTHSVFVGNLPRTLRVSEMKNQIRNQGVNPLKVVWHGGSGHAFLVFLKKREANYAIEKLTNVVINDQNIRVEMSRGNKEKQRTASEQSETGAESNE